MANEFAGLPNHSAEYFGDTRDYWYNDDFLPLIAQRWELSRVSRALDVGCGAGHWGRLLLRMLPAEAHLVGLDRDPLWLGVAAKRAPPGRCTFVQGDAAALPFEDDSFDLVSCQTVLIHCPDPAAVVREMVRVCKPGGRVAVSEPNNATNVLADPMVLGLPMEEALALVRLQLTCERGKTALGLGDISIGEQVPRFFLDAGLRDLRVFLSDNAYAMLPPYSTPAQRAAKEEMEDAHNRGHFAWSEEESRRYALAGGASDAEFAALWKLAGEASRHRVEAMSTGQWVQAGGHVSYLISGIKPG